MCVFLSFSYVWWNRQPWGGRRGQTKKILPARCVLETATRWAAGMAGGAVIQLPLSASGQTKGSLRDLEIPESVGCGNSLRESRGRMSGVWGSERVGEPSKVRCVSSHPSHDRGPTPHCCTLVCLEVSLTMGFMRAQNKRVFSNNLKAGFFSDCKWISHGVFLACQLLQLMCM